LIASPLPDTFRGVLKYRLISGPILIALFLGLVWLDEWAARPEVTGVPGLVLLALAMLTAPLMAIELTGIIRKKGVAARPWLMTLAVMLGLGAMFIGPVIAARLDEPGEMTLSLTAAPTGAVIVFALSLLVFCRGENTQGVILASAANLLGFVYLGLALGFYFLIRHEHSAWWIVGIIMTTKMCDSGAFFTGRTIGKHKLIPWLSPGKTWEGFFGGIIAAALAGTGFAALSRFLPHADDHVVWWMGAIAGVVFGLFGQWGDLAMSVAKRDAGVKDSSTILPGLGGFLDVLDSPILVAPVAYWLFAVA